MRRLFLGSALAVTLLAAGPAFAEIDERDTLIGVNAAAPVLGFYSASFQQLVRNDLGIFVRPVFYSPPWSLVWRDERALVPEKWTYWELYADLGVNYYPQNEAPQGFFAGLGLAPGYLFLEDHVKNQAPGFRLAVVTQIGYQFVWGPVAVTPRGSMVYRMPFADLDSLDDAALERGIDPVVSGFQLGFGLDLAIAF